MDFVIGGYKVTSYILDLFRLDGGAMFGSVPKSLWEREFPADEKNRIQLCSRVLLLEGQGRKILVDAGCGSCWNDKERAIFNIEPQYSQPLVDLFPGVTDVVLTHLHFDHAGGISHGSGNAHVPSFPQARHWLSRENYERAKAPGIRERVSYRKIELEVLDQIDLKLVESGEEIFPNVVLNNLYGHTYGMSWVGIRENNQYALIFFADLCPTSAHLKIPYVMGYDLLAEVTMEEKEVVLEMALDHKSLIVFEHDPQVGSGYLGRDSRGVYVIHSQVNLDGKL